MKSSNVWRYWQESFIHMSENLYGEYIPAAGLGIAIILQAAKDRDIEWIEGADMEAWCEVTGLKTLWVRECIFNTYNFLNGKCKANFEEIK